MRVVFVCTANMCRSPMAERLFAKRLEERGVAGIAVSSAGVFAFPGSPPSEGMRLEAAARGIDLSAHRARRFQALEIGPGDLVLVMEHAHRHELLEVHGVPEQAVRLLGSFDPTGPEEVEDPVAGRASYAVCADRIGLCLEGLYRWLAERDLRPGSPGARGCGGHRE